MGASSFTALSTPNPPQHLGSGSRNVGLLPRHLCPDETFSSISGGDKGRKAHVLVSSEDSGGFSRVLGSHTHSLFLWPEKHLPKESRSIKRVWLVCTQQCTVGSGHLQESTRQCCPVDGMVAADMACAGGSLWFTSGCPLALSPHHFPAPEHGPGHDTGGSTRSSQRVK